MVQFNSLIFACALAASISITPSHALAAKGGGGHELGVSAGVISAEQEHMNTLIKNANTRAGGISTGAMNSAYEFTVHYGYRFNGSIIALLFRPSFFYQKQIGSGGSGATLGSYNYSATGFTFFPMMRITPLENDFMKFFMQLGIGYGRASSSIEEASAKVEFAGDAFGTVAGLGAEFCFIESHCLVTEGNYRYLTIQRNIATSASGTFDSTTSLTQAVTDREVEIAGDDLAIRMSGLQFLVGYILHF